VDSPSSTNARPMSRSNLFVRGLVLQLALLVGTLVIVELILRVIDLRELRDGYNVGSNLTFQFDKELGWRPIPNIVAQYRGSRTITIRTNSLGLRDIEHAHVDRPTVLFLGDSFVWGYDVEQNERFTEILRTNFREFEWSMRALAVMGPIRNTFCFAASGATTSPM
jgi:hypothetical protein